MEEDDGGVGEGSDEGVEVGEGGGHALGWVGALEVDVPGYEFDGGGDGGWWWGGGGGGNGVPFGVGEGVVGLRSFRVGRLASW